MDHSMAMLNNQRVSQTDDCRWLDSMTPYNDWSSMDNMDSTILSINQPLYNHWMIVLSMDDDCRWLDSITPYNEPNLIMLVGWWVSRQFWVSSSFINMYISYISIIYVSKYL